MPVVTVSGAENPKAATVIWNRAIDNPTITASGSAVDYPAVNVTQPGTYSSWKADGANGWLQFDFGAAVQVDGAGIGAHNLATSGVTAVVVQSSTDGTTWTSRATYNPLTNEDIIAIFPVVTARYWRIQLTGPAANIGCVAIGKRLVFPHSPVDDYTPLRHSRQYTKLFNNSIAGQLLGNRVMGAGASTTVDFGFVPITFVENALPEFADHYNQGGTFFYAASPSAFPRELGYCWAIGEDAIINVSYIEAAKLATLSFGVNSYVSA